MKIILSILILVGLLVISLMNFSAEKGPAPTEQLLSVESPGAEVGFVLEVINGETLKMANGDIIKLIGVYALDNTPSERAQRDAKRSEQKLKTILDLGDQSTTFLKKLVEGQKVLLEPDVRKKDLDGRVLAYVYFGPEWLRESVKNKEQYGKNAFRRVPRGWYFGHGTNALKQPHEQTYVFINATMIKSGYALPLNNPFSVRHAELFEELHQEAIEYQRGLWKKRANVRMLNFDANEIKAELRKESCRKHGGAWDIFPESTLGHCEFPVPDGGTPCMDTKECEGYCIVEPTEEELSRHWNSLGGIKMQGTCAKTRPHLACSYIVEEGLVNRKACGTWNEIDEY